MNEVLNHRQILQKINRLGFEIIENCYPEREIYLGGINGNGLKLAKMLRDIVEKNSEMNVHVFEVQLKKDEPWAAPTALTISEDVLKEAYIYLIDDVINSGKTMQYALIKLLQFPTKAIKTVALVDRTHRRYPIHADYVGIRLSTTLKNRVDVELDPEKSTAFLI
jgi:pyrimidine operon attenuation protein/uracil phosphoribosyltransferase